MQIKVPLITKSSRTVAQWQKITINKIKTKIKLHNLNLSFTHVSHALIFYVNSFKTQFKNVFELQFEIKIVLLTSEVKVNH